MSFIIYPDIYDSIMHFYEKGFLNLQIDEDIFDKEVIENMKKNNFKGTYTFVLSISWYKKKFYDFVALTHFKTDGIPIVTLAPMKMKDEEFAKYFHAADDFDENQEYVNYWIYTSYKPSAYHTDKNELVDFGGVVRPIQVGENYVTENGINYLVYDEIIEPPIRTKEHLENMGYWKRMEEDCFMGKFIVRYGYNTGEIADDVYTISLVDNERIYLEPCSLRNEYNMPNFVWYDEEHTEDNVTVIRSEYIEFYVPYDGKEDILKTPCYKDILDSYKTI